MENYQESLFIPAGAEGGSLMILEDVTRQVRYFAQKSAENMLLLGKALTEAKAMVPHGEWAEYVKRNTGLGERTAQNFMQAFKKFGTGNAILDGMSIGQIIPLLPATDEEIGKLAAENNLKGMSKREIEKALKKAREEAETEAAEKTRETLAAMAEDKARELARQKENFDRQMEAERKGKAAEIEQLTMQLTESQEKAEQSRKNREAYIETLKTQLTESREAADALRKAAEDAEARAKDATQAAIDGARDVSAQSSKLEAEARKLRAELNEKDEMVQELQEQYDALNRDYLNLQSSTARGDAERTDADILSAEAFGDAVKMFIGQVGRIPYMHGTFATMDAVSRDTYSAYVMQVKEWAEKSLAALDTIATEGGVY